MRRCPHRINFRLTTEQHEKFAKMIGKLYCVTNWTDLCVKALTELSRTHMGPWSDPLDVPNYNALGEPLDPPLLTGKDQRIVDAEFLARDSGQFRNKNGKLVPLQLPSPRRRKKKKVDKTRKRK